MNSFPIVGAMRRVSLGLCLIAGLLVASPVLTSRAAYASGVAQTCSYSQLELATSQSGSGAAAGNEGIAFIIVNDGKTACTLDGYPRLRVVPSTFKGKTVKVVDGGGMIFTAVKPRLVTIAPDATASFGVDYGDAYNQQDPDGGLCISNNFDFSFPVKAQPFSQYLGSTERINFCFAGFMFTVTSIQSGPMPRQG